MRLRLKFWGRVILGIPVLLVIVIVFVCRDADFAASVLFAAFCSIILTGGLLLLLYVPVLLLILYVLGAIVTIFWSPGFLDVKESVQLLKAGQVDKDVLTVFLYLKKLKDPCSDRERVVATLKDAGWSKEVIDSAFELVEKK